MLKRSAGDKQNGRIGHRSARSRPVVHFPGYVGHENRRLWRSRLQYRSVLRFQLAAGQQVHAAFAKSRCVEAYVWLAPVDRDRSTEWIKIEPGSIVAAKGAAPIGSAQVRGGATQVLQDTRLHD